MKHFKKNYHLVKAVGFDFDGTLISSEDQKAVQMAKIFNEKFGIRRGVLQKYKKLSGKSLNRTQKINSLFREFLHRAPTEKEISFIHDQFGEYYKRVLRTCPLFECTNLIKELKRQVKFVFLLSLEEAREVRKIANHCGLGKYFDEILGGPKSKIDNLRSILKKHHLLPVEIIYIGDAHSDVVSGKNLGIKVILLGRKHVYEKLKEDLEADFVFGSLCDIPYRINDI